MASSMKYTLSKTYDAKTLAQINAALDFYRHILIEEQHNPTILYNIGLLEYAKGNYKE